MRWLIFAGYCGLALVLISVAGNNALQIIQKPRFYGVKTGSQVGIYCQASQGQTSGNWQWYWADTHNGSKKLLPGVKKNIVPKDRFLHIVNARTEDSGVYFCKKDDIWGPGTALQVARNISLTEALFRTRMKDGLIIFQGLLLAVCIAAVLLRKRDMLEKRDIIYEEPETDHIYEGLAIETCGGGLYEELSVYAQADGAEAPWE
uniref:B-cell antigen receptor complex-associated protein beta chain n=1 Tax=Semicossyphus pulcher TaxID=241346 RepID=UPI0037E88E9D